MFSNGRWLPSFDSNSAPGWLLAMMFTHSPMNFDGPLQRLRHAPAERGAQAVRARGGAG